MNNYCKKCRLRDGCMQKCKEAEIYEQGYNDAYKVLKALNMRQEKEKDGIQRKDPQPRTPQAVAWKQTRQQELPKPRHLPMVQAKPKPQKADSEDQNQ